jgi:hypothetical protein
MVDAASMTPPSDNTFGAGFFAIRGRTKHQEINGLFIICPINKPYATNAPFS